jgi:hypothetical protein
MLKINWKLDDSVNTEWSYPEYQPVEKLHLKEADSESLQVFLGNRVIGAIHKNYFLSVFNQGNGYEFIEEWKIRHHLALRQLNGKQIIKITELLRNYGHNKGIK